jgi:excisionase family DNA binding protein
MIDEVYTPLEVATMLRVTRTTIYEHIKSGQLKAIRIGNRYRITKAQLEEYIQQNVVNGTKSVIDPKRDGEPPVIWVITWSKEGENMVSPRIREVQDKQEMQRVVDDFMTQGYTIKDQGTDTTLLKKKSWGSAAGIIVSIILGGIVAIFTVGLGLLIIPAYMIYAHYSAPEVLIRIARAQPQAPSQVLAEPDVVAQPQR